VAVSASLSTMIDTAEWPRSTDTVLPLADVASAAGGDRRPNGPGSRRRAPASARLLVFLAAGLLAAEAVAATVYRWVDAEGTVHLSSSRPPAGVLYETLQAGGHNSKSSTGAGAATANPANAQRRQEVIAGLQNRECVIALEALDRLTNGTAPTNPSELRRLQQTADMNCSRDPARRREQEDMAAQLRVANGAACVQARHRLEEMLALSAPASREQLKIQQDFVSTHCTAPVR